MIEAEERLEIWIAVHIPMIPAPMMTISALSFIIIQFCEELIKVSCNQFFYFYLKYIKGLF
jgi:hypothetical protein